MAVSTSPPPPLNSKPSTAAPAANRAANDAAAAAAAEEEEEEEEEDYMSMTITEPAAPKEKETYTQRRIRKQREAEAKSHRPLSSSSTTTTNAALTTPLPLHASNKGFAIMSKLGFIPGSSLGATTDARTEPLALVMKEDRGGIGLESERKRKVREEFEREGKRVRAEEGAYRERVGAEREGRRVEALVVGAMGVCEGLDCEDDEEAEQGEGGNEGKRKSPTRPLKFIPLPYRSLIRNRQQAERDRRMRYDLHQSLSRNAAYMPDPDLDKDDRLAIGDVEEEVEEDDPELEAFEALEPAERLGRVVAYLRERWWYCFWCKCRFESAGMEGCPGKEEGDHD
ncbi:hypothetical protein MMC16_000418 [Acarospora aff. strigata]|nr:hypothetical protein [Acarospora aff. strigata]